MGPMALAPVFAKPAATDFPTNSLARLLASRFCGPDGSESIPTIDTFVAGLSSEELRCRGKKSKKGLRAEPALPAVRLRMGCCVSFRFRRQSGVEKLASASLNVRNTTACGGAQSYAYPNYCAWSSFHR
jgi:hypothetical protein